MIRLLIVLVCLSALALALCGIASRFTITLTIAPINGKTTNEPAPQPAPAVPTKPKASTVKVDSHHTKGA